MRRFVLRLFVTVSVFSALTCGGLDTFSITESASTTVSGSVLGQLTSLGFGGFLDLDISENSELQNQGVERNQIDSVKLRMLTLTVTDTLQGQNFDFLSEVSFFVEAPGLERILLASGSGFESLCHGDRVAAKEWVPVVARFLTQVVVRT
ncbi:MAG: hypothetical protein AAFQ82_02835 [Myxococcota bacterium]